MTATRFTRRADVLRALRERGRGGGALPVAVIVIMVIVFLLLATARGTPVRIAGSTAIAPRAPSLTPALTARLVSGRTPVTTKTRPACRVTGPPPAAVASTRSLADSPVRARPISLTVVPVRTVTP